MKTKIIFTLIIICFVNSSSVLHPLKMSVADIVYREQKLYMKVKFFTDDLESTLGQFCKVPLDIFNKGIQSNTEKCIQGYMNANFAMYIKNSPVKWVYKKAYLKGEENDVVMVEYEAQLTNVSKIKSVKIKNTLLFDGIREQKNLVNINLFGEVKVLTFKNDPKEYTKELTY